MVARRGFERRSARDRIKALLTKSMEMSNNSEVFDPQMDAHRAKYICVLVSGYVEQAIKEILFEHFKKHLDSKSMRYCQSTWQKSRNLKCSAMLELLRSFDSDWESQLSDWFADGPTRKDDLNTLITWRNQISHGVEENTSGVTYGSIQSKFNTICSLVDEVERIVTS